MKLYEISKDLIDLQALIDSGEMTEEDLKDTLESVNMEFKDKVQNCCMIIQQNNGNSAAINEQINRLKYLDKRYSESSSWMLSYIKNNMISSGIDKIDTNLFKLTLRKPTLQLGSIDESKVPELFFITIPESKVLDKKALLSARKLGDIDGVELKDSDRSLSIK